MLNILQGSEVDVTVTFGLTPSGVAGTWQKHNDVAPPTSFTLTVDPLNDKLYTGSFMPPATGIYVVRVVSNNTAREELVGVRPSAMT